MILPLLGNLTAPILRPLVYSLREASGAGISEFNPSALFASSTGYVYDLNDLSTVWQDSAGTVAGVVNQPVGLVLDKSQGLPLGADFCVNGSFATDTTWVKGAGWAISGGKANKTAGTPNTLAQSYALTVGKAYKITYTVSGRTAGTCAACLLGGTTVADPLVGTNATRTCILIAVTGNIQFGITADGTFDGSIDDYSIQELSGNHRTQSTAASRPILRGTPTGANLVTNGDFATDTVWTKQAGWTISGGTANVNSAVSGTTIISQGTTVSGRVYRVTWTLTSITSGNVRPYIGAATTTTRGVAGTYVDYITAIDTGQPIGLAGTNTNTVASIDNVQIHDVSADSVTTPYALQYDGTDDFLQTASVDFTATDKMTVCHGVRKLSDAALGVVLELSADSNTNLRAFRMDAPSSPTTRSYNVQSIGTLQAGVFIAGYPAPNTSVVGGVFDIGADICRLRINGAQVAETTADQGTGNYGNYPLYFGRRGGTVLPFNGLEYSSICVGKAVSTQELANIERWVAQRTGVTL